MSRTSIWLARGLRSARSVSRSTEPDSGPTVLRLLFPSQPAPKSVIDELLERDALLFGFALSALDQIGIQFDCLCLRCRQALIVLLGMRSLGFSGVPSGDGLLEANARVPEFHRAVSEGS